MATSLHLQLPNDIVIEILTQLKRVSDTTQDLTSCARVNKAWHDATAPLLYGNIALDVANTARFCNDLVREKHAADVRSISLSVEPYYARQSVTQLASLLPQLTNLRSFSFRLAEPLTVEIPHHYLVQLVEALPPSCTDLELDTHGKDERYEDCTTHLCTSLRSILPRLRHVRLRLRTCEALFADPSTLVLTKLKTLIYSCVSGRPIPVCRVYSLDWLD